MQRMYGYALYFDVSEKDQDSGWDGKGSRACENFLSCLLAGAATGTAVRKIAVKIRDLCYTVRKRVPKWK